MEPDSITDARKYLSITAPCQFTVPAVNPHGFRHEFPIRYNEQFARAMSSDVNDYE